jgi:O-antigen/teichoic acid export membrane protein
MSSDIAPRLARNSAYYAIKSFVALAAMLLITPYILKTIGKEQYGIWALAGVMTSYVQLSDLGITESLVKYASEYHASRDSANLNRLVNTATAALLSVSVVLGYTLYLFLPIIIKDILNIPVQFQEEALLIFRLSVFIFLFNLIMGVFATLVVSSQQIGYTCSINIATSVFGFIVTIICLRQGLGLRSLIATNAIVALFVAVLNMIVASKLFPELQFNFRKWVDLPMFKQIFSFSWKVQTASISHLLIFQIDRILLSRYLGLEAVAYYEIGSTAAFHARSFLSVLFTPMVSAVSAMKVQNEQALITGLYHRSFKFLVMLAVPFCLLVIAVASPFIQMWMGSGFALSAITLQLLMPAYLINILTGPGTFILNGMNRPDVAMRSAILAGITNLLLCFVLVKTIGYFGLIIGISISLVTSTGYFLSMLHQVLPNIEWGMYGRTIAKPFLFSIPVAVALYYLDTFWSLASLPALAISSLLYGALIVMMLLKSAYLDDFERKILSGLFLFKQRES